VCIVVTANHYWIDGLGGLLCLAIGYAIAHAITVRFRPPIGSAARPVPAEG
jgi:hypothetical protein